VLSAPTIPHPWRPRRGGGGSVKRSPTTVKETCRDTHPATGLEGVVRVRVESCLPHSEQGMYENSCINLSSSPAPRLQQGPEENDAKEKLNPMSKIRQTQLLLSTRWPPGLGGGGTHRGQEARLAGRGGALWSGVRPALAWPFSFLGLCGGSDMDEAGPRH